MKNTAKILVPMVIFAACASQQSENGDAQEKTLRFLALGDSYTIGEKVGEELRWPVQLAGLMRQKGFAVESPEIIARTGWTAEELNEAIDAASPRGSYDLVTLLIGVNNQYRGVPAEEFRPHFQNLLGRAVGFAGGNPRRVVVVSIPDWGVTPFAMKRDPIRIGREIDEFNAVVRQEAEKAKARFVDVTEISRREREMVAEDDLHPSGAMYGEWAGVILAEAVAAVGGAED